MFYENLWTQFHYIRSLLDAISFESIGRKSTYAHWTRVKLKRIFVSMFIALYLNTHWKYITCFAPKTSYNFDHKNILNFDKMD